MVAPLKHLTFTDLKLIQKRFLLVLSSPFVIKIIFLDQEHASVLKISFIDVKGFTKFVSLEASGEFTLYSTVAADDE